MPKKSLIVKPKIYGKVDEVFHKLFFDKKACFDLSGLEIIVDGSVESSTKKNGRQLFQKTLFGQRGIQSIPKTEYKHKFKTRGRYLKFLHGKGNLRRSNAFEWIQDEIVWDHNRPLLEDYRGKIAQELETLHYSSSENEGIIVVRSAVNQSQIRQAITSYINSKDGYLEGCEFRELTGASECDLQNLFGPHHNTITDRRYSTQDVLTYSKRFTHVFDENVVGRNRFPKTRYNPNANIMNIYRRTLGEGSSSKITADLLIPIQS